MLFPTTLFERCSPICRKPWLTGTGEPDARKRSQALDVVRRPPVRCKEPQHLPVVIKLRYQRSWDVEPRFGHAKVAFAFLVSAERLRRAIPIREPRLACLGTRRQGRLRVGLDGKVGRSHGSPRGQGPRDGRARPCRSGSHFAARLLL